MRIPLASPHLFILLACLACKPGGGGTAEGSTSDTTAASTGPGATDTSASSEPTTGDGTSVGMTATSMTSVSSSSTTADPDTSTSDPVTSDPATSEPQTSDPVTTDDPVESGGPPEDECVTDDDCKLQNDCCACDGVPVDEDVASCEKECDQPLCDQFGVEKAVCRLGVCEAERLSCDQAKVSCNEPPPVCPPGTLPETDAECWTGTCLPPSLCDVVPDCGFCGPEQFCVTKQGEGFFPTVCEPLPGHCGGTSSCNCVGELVCLQPFGLCFQTDTLAVSCECPNC